MATFAAQQQGGAVKSSEFVPFPERLANAVVSYVRYLKKTFWPDDLAVFYPHPGTWSAWQVGGAAVLLILISWLAVRHMRNRLWLAMGWFWFLGTLVPVLGLVQVGWQSMADRYLYVPSIGLFIMFAWSLEECAERTKQPLPAKAIATFSLAGCLLVTWWQTGFWKNTETLFKHDIALTGYNYIACSDLGAYLVAQNRADESVFYFEKALTIDPSSGHAHFNLGIALARQGHAEQAAEHFSKGVELAPNNADVHLNLGNALAKLGKMPAAIEQFRAVTALRPDSSDAHKVLGNALAEQRDFAGAIAEFMIVAQANPRDPETQMQLGSFYSQEGKAAEAIEHCREAVLLYREALQRNPESLALLNNFAWALATNPNAEIRNGSEAVKLALQACEDSHWKHAVLVGTLAAAYAESGEFDKAADMARKAHEMALAVGEKEIAEKNRELLQFYEAHKPYRDN